MHMKSELRILHRREQAFTLIELLVVIGIIGILAGLPARLGTRTIHRPRDLGTRHRTAQENRRLFRGDRLHASARILSLAPDAAAVEKGAPISVSGQF